MTRLGSLTLLGAVPLHSSTARTLRTTLYIIFNGLEDETSSAATCATCKRRKLKIAGKYLFRRCPKSRRQILLSENVSPAAIFPRLVWASTASCETSPDLSGHSDKSGGRAAKKGEETNGESAVCRVGCTSYHQQTSNATSQYLMTSRQTD